MDRIVGQVRAIELLQSAFGGDRLHHAYIFHGPHGVGKFTTARAFARVLLCHAEIRATRRVLACGTCRSCTLLASDGHPDEHVITKELARFSDEAEVRKRKLMTIPVDVLKTRLIEPVQRAASLGHGKVFIVDEAELLDNVGQNILLKTLEEPPPDTFLMLVTASEDRLLPTVRSRCLRVPFVHLGDDAVADWLERDDRVEAARRRSIVAFANGSLGRAELAARYELDAWERIVSPALDEMAEGRYAAVLGKELADLLNEFAQRWVDDHDGASKDAANKQAATVLCGIVSQTARRQLALVSGRTEPGDLDGSEAALRPWLHVIEAVGRAEREMRSNVNMGLVMDHFVSLLYRALSGQAGLSCNTA